MRIALVTTSWPAGDGDASGHFVRAEARALERSGHQVLVISPAPGGAFGWPGAAARVRDRPWRAIDAARWVVRARSQVAALQVERVVAHWAVPCGWPVAAAADATVRVDVVSHGADVRLLLGLPTAMRAPLAHAIAGRATTWRFVSVSLRDALLGGLEGSTRARVARIAVVEAAAIEMPDVSEAVDRKRRELGGLRFAVSVGRLVASKRVDRAIDHVARARDLDALVVVGDGPERRRLEGLARERGVDARFVGRVPREEALAWIGAAQVLVHVSEAEGLSTVVREAEALGTPVIGRVIGRR